MQTQKIERIMVKDKEIVSPNVKNPSMNTAGPYITLETLGGKATRGGDIWYQTLTQMLEDRKIPRQVIEIVKGWNKGKLPGAIKNGSINWTTLYIVLALNWDEIESELLDSIPVSMRSKFLSPPASK